MEIMSRMVGNLMFIMQLYTMYERNAKRRSRRITLLEVSKLLTNITRSLARYLPRVGLGGIGSTIRSQWTVMMYGPNMWRYVNIHKDLATVCADYKNGTS
jgi:hypothetical protein